MFKKKILVADDEMFVRTLLVEVLEQGGYDVTAVEDGMEAWREIEKEVYDLVVSDYLMPCLDGLQLACLVNANHPCLPIMIISGEDLDGALPESTTFTFIKKPFSIKEVLTIVQSLLDKSPSADKF